MKPNPVDEPTPIAGDDRLGVSVIAQQRETSSCDAEELTRVMLESFDDGFCVIELILDASGQRAVDFLFVEVNSAFVVQAGIADAKGRTARQLVPDLDEFWYETFVGIALTGEALRFERYEASLQRWVEVQAMRFGAPERRRLAIVFRDITGRREREERLRTSESTLRSIYDSTSFLIGIVELPDDDSDIVHVFDSPATERFFGCAPGGMVGASARSLGTAPETLARWIGHYRDSQREQRAVQFAYVHPGPDGPRWLESTVSYIGRAASGRTRFSYLAEDVTERRRAEQHQRDRAVHVRLAMEASLAIAFEWDIRADRVRRLESIEEALPVTDGEPDTFEGVLQVVHPADRALFRANIDAALASDDGQFRSEYRIVRPSGEVRWLSETGRVEFDSTHQPIRLLGISQDVTERRRAEDERRRQAQLISLSHDPIMVWSASAGIIDWNAGAEQLFGYTRDEALGRKVHDLLRTRHSIPLAQFLSELERTGEWTGELCHVAKDGREIIVESRQQMIDVSGDRLVLESNRDITARLAGEKALHEAHRRKDEFIAILAHELRNPLAPVRSAVELMRMEQLSDPRLQRARDVIDRQVTHMARLIDDLLDVSRIARGKLALQKQRCDLASITRQTADDYRPNLEAAGLQLIVSGTSPAWVDGDPVRLAQMVGNLLNNAGRFTERGGRVEVATSADVATGLASVTVSDNGVGIDRELLRRLFDPFSQAEQDLARSKGGLGIGLALTKGLVELHGGQVEAHSEGPGHGATFVLRLPLVAAPEAHVRDGAAAPARAALRILIVEDNEDAARMLGELLELGGHHVKLAFDGVNGVSTARGFQPDVVISDLGLPGELDGYGVAAALRSDPTTQRAYMIAMSGYASEDVRARSSQVGFDAHLAKPTDLARLKLAIAEATATRRGLGPTGTQFPMRR
ncbi:MAG: PAS domain S-box protein [Kofleriaceae bacterium]|nr:PAS domain S-box protein [Kofleriaceae bacterium]